MNLLDQLTNQSAALIRIIDKLISLITMANENKLSEKQLNALMDNVTKTLNLVELFKENCNEFIAKVESG